MVYLLRAERHGYNGLIKFTAARKSKKVLRADFFLRQFKYFLCMEVAFYWAFSAVLYLLFGAFWRGAVLSLIKTAFPAGFSAVSSVVMFMPFILLNPA
jgi:hypothetical protein